MNRLSTVFAAALLTGVCGGAMAATVPETEAQIKAAQTLTAEFNAAIKAGQKYFKIPRGTYRFPDHFDLDNLKGITIDGQGSTFIFKLGGGKVRVLSCSDVTLKNLYLDLDRPPIIQGSIVAVDYEHKTIDMKADQGYSAGHPNSKAKLRCMLIGAKSGRELPVPDANTPPPVRLESGLLRIQPARVFDVGKGVFAPGDKVVLSLHSSGSGVTVRNSSNITLEDIVIYAAGGFAFHESGISDGGNVYRRCRLVIRPGSGALAAGAADAFHSMHQKKGPKLIDCEFSHAFDDLINIHGFLNLVIEKRAPNQLVIAGPFEQDFGVGSVLKFYKSPDAVPLGEAKVQQCVRLSNMTPQEAEAKAAKYYATACQSRPVVRSFPSSQPCLVTLDRPIGVSEFDLVSSSDYVGRGALVDSCKLHDGHIRGILFKSPDGIIKNCVIERIASSGIILKPEQYWLEGPFPYNVKIIDNRITDCGSSFLKSASIEMRSEFGRSREKLTNACNISKVEIARNRIVNAAGIAIKIINAADVTVNDNVIINPLSQLDRKEKLDFSAALPVVPAVSPEIRAAMTVPYYAIFIAASKNVHGKGNLVETLPACSKGMVGRGAWTEQIDIK